jgi:hypothetical protein
MREMLPPLLTSSIGCFLVKAPERALLSRITTRLLTPPTFTLPFCFLSLLSVGLSPCFFMDRGLKFLAVCVSDDG